MPYAAASALRCINNKAVPYRDLKSYTYLNCIYTHIGNFGNDIYEMLLITNRITYIKITLSSARQQ